MVFSLCSVSLKKRDLPGKSVKESWIKAKQSKSIWMIEYAQHAFVSREDYYRHRTVLLNSKVIQIYERLKRQFIISSSSSSSEGKLYLIFILPYINISSFIFHLPITHLLYYTHDFSFTKERKRRRRKKKKISKWSELMTSSNHKHSVFNIVNKTKNDFIWAIWMWLFTPYKFFLHSSELCVHVWMCLNRN